MLIGECGTGKTHLATGLCVAACRQKRKVRFTTTANLVNELVEASQQQGIRRVLARWMRYDVIALDEVGYVPLAEIGAEFLFQVIAERAERATLILTTNLPFSEWAQVFPSLRTWRSLAAAIISADLPWGNCVCFLADFLLSTYSNPPEGQAESCIVLREGEANQSAKLFGGCVSRTRRYGQCIPILVALRWDAENLLEILRLHPVVIRFQEYPGLGVELRIVQRGCQLYGVLVHSRVALLDVRVLALHVPLLVEPGSLVQSRRINDERVVPIPVAYGISVKSRIGIPFRVDVFGQFAPIHPHFPPHALVLHQNRHPVLHRLEPQSSPALRARD